MRKYSSGDIIHFKEQQGEYYIEGILLILANAELTYGADDYRIDSYYRVKLLSDIYGMSWIHDENHLFLEYKKPILGNYIDIKLLYSFNAELRNLLNEKT